MACRGARGNEFLGNNTKVFVNLLPSNLLRSGRDGLILMTYLEKETLKSECSFGETLSIEECECFFKIIIVGGRPYGNTYWRLFDETLAEWK